LKFAFESRATSRGGGKEGRLAPARPATPSRGCAARVAGPECTNVLEDRKRRPDAAPDPDRRPSVNRRIEPVVLARRFCALLADQTVALELAVKRRRADVELLGRVGLVAAIQFQGCEDVFLLDLVER
jgi:hypothetical protein